MHEKKKKKDAREHLPIDKLIKQWLNTRQIHIGLAFMGWINIIKSKMTTILIYADLLRLSRHKCDEVFCLMCLFQFLFIKGSHTQSHPTFDSVQ